MFLLRIIVFIVIIIFTLPYLKKGADIVMKRIPNEFSNSVNNLKKQAKEVIKNNLQFTIFFYFFATFSLFERFKIFFK